MTCLYLKNFWLHTQLLTSPEINTDTQVSEDVRHNMNPIKFYKCATLHLYTADPQNTAVLQVQRGLW